MDTIKRFGFFCAAFLILQAGMLFAAGDKTVTLGGSNGWGMVKAVNSVTYLDGVRPNPVLSLTSTKKFYTHQPDLLLDFDSQNTLAFADSADNYAVRVGAQIYSVPQRHARIGRGAALFSGDTSTSLLLSTKNDAQNAPLTISAKNNNALFCTNNTINSFSIEFWLYPNSLETGEEIITWNASLRKNQASGRMAAQQNFNFYISKNRSHWAFTNLFSSANGGQTFDMVLNGKDPLVPKTWSHHILRFDGVSGLLEYVINGVTQNVVFATDTGRENGEARSVVCGERGIFVVGKNFNGMLDDLKIFDKFLENYSMSRYPSTGGRLESDPVDLGTSNTKVSKIDVFGGRVNAVFGGINESRQNGNFKFSDDSQIQFFVRASNSKYALQDNPWQIFNAGKDITTLKGRFVQIAADLYPSGNCENTPYIEEIKILYNNQSLPAPIQKISALARDGSVELRWKRSDAANIGGYIVYYGTSSGVYFCEDALQGVSPFDVGKENAVTVSGLKNGTLYYFAVCAYNNEGEPQQGDFSNEVTARPLGGGD
ncbi:MAG: hypothetical protein Ta2B_03660 [Termitinemataceae bacterium]|nr:MAG: hypothetical protein Ta2B_03660 [Termitinemataceae bacterium]